MDIKNIKGVEVKNNFDIDTLKSVVAKSYAGNTLLFIGAGFSLESKNHSNTPIPLAKDLSKKICELGGFEEDDDLAYSADYFLKYNDAEKLIALLTDNFTIKEATEYQRIISKVDWRRIYTTNYDNCFELAAGNTGRVISPLTLEDNPTKNFRRRDICIHINGAIQLLDEKSLEGSFKLTDSSYTNSDAFTDSSWLYRFRKDIDACSQILFVGYSLYDMEVKRLLVKNEDIKKKTFFITRTDVSTKEHHRLSAFGEVFPIGAEGFAGFLQDHVPPDLPTGLDYLESLEKIRISYDSDFSDNDIRDFLLRGRTELNSIASSITARDKLFAASRNQTNEILERLNDFDAAVVYGSIASGKSIVAQQVMAQLLISGEEVYVIRDEEAKYENDIEILSDVDKRVFLVVDDFEKNIEVVKYFFAHLGGKGKLILTERPHRYRRAISQLEQVGASIFTTNVDYLQANEIEDLAKLISSSGLWGVYAGYSYEKQNRFLTSNCESQISVVLLKLLESPHVAERFRSSFSDILKYPETKKTVHAICLIQHIYPKQCTKSYIADISDSNHVYSSVFEERIRESGLFDLEGNSFKIQSAIFSTFILSNFYRSSYTIDQLVRIAEKLQRNRVQQSYEEREMYRSIMTFGTLSSILPKKDKPNSYVQFYEKLKREVPNVIGHPHYWLQYAMSIMSEGNFSDAERILETAYSKARNSPGYDTTYMDNQFARLRLRQAIDFDDQSQSVKHFLDAHRMLSREENDIFKFRQAGLYITYYEKRYGDLSKGNKAKFEHALKEILREFEEYLDFEYLNGVIPPFQKEKIEEFRTVVENIVNDRSS